MYTIASSQARTRLPLAAICCLGLIGFLIAATIVLALIPLYILSPRTLNANGVTQITQTIATTSTTQLSKTFYARYIVNPDPIDNSLIGNVENLSQMSSRMGISTNAEVIVGQTQPEFTRRRRNVANRRQKRTLIRKFLFTVRTIFSSTCIDQTCQDNAIATVQQRIRQTGNITNVIISIKSNNIITNVTVNLIFDSILTSSIGFNDTGIGSNTFTAVQSGLSNVPEIWSRGVIPYGNCIIIIPQGITITHPFSSFEINVTRIEIFGKLIFGQINENFTFNYPISIIVHSFGTFQFVQNIPQIIFMPIGSSLTIENSGLFISTTTIFIQFYNPINGENVGLPVILPTTLTGPYVVSCLTAQICSTITNPLDTSTTTTSSESNTTINSLNSSLVDSIHIEDLMKHLNEFQRIANNSNGNRAVTTTGFNQTVDYIYNTLADNTNYNISKTFFYVRQFALASNPILISSINGTIHNYTYSTNFSIADFYHIGYSTMANLTDFIEVTVIPNVGCSDDDWKTAIPSPVGKVALVKRGICAFVDKSVLAAKYNVVGVLFYNDGETSDHILPFSFDLNPDNNVPVLFLSFPVGQKLADAAQSSSTNVSVRFIINLQNLPLAPIENICADTPTGSVTQTIVIGSHSDSVPRGPGINDNGSGIAANLELAIGLARLFQTSTYDKYKYRVRFCWWGAEEINLRGSRFFVNQAKNSTVVGERLSDYLVNLNYDMLASPNYFFGIHEAHTVSNGIPVEALPGSIKITDVYRDWFIRQNLPWDYTALDGQSDYEPFLAEGIACGGLVSGADEIKTQEEHDRYERILGQGMGGIANASHDSCYHQACDTIQNINMFAFEKLVKAAAYILEYLARQDDLKNWLYPTK